MYCLENVQRKKTLGHLSLMIRLAVQAKYKPNSELREKLIPRKICFFWLCGTVFVFDRFLNDMLRYIYSC